MTERMSEMIVRVATQEDVKPLHKIYLDAATKKQQYGDYAWRDGFSEKGVRWMVDQGTTYCTLVGNEIVGVTALDWSDDGWDDDADNNAGYIRRLAVAEGYHGKNIGGQILDWAAEQARINGKKYLRLDAPAENEQLCAYYERQGFVALTEKRFEESDVLVRLYQKLV